MLWNRSVLATILVLASSCGGGDNEGSGLQSVEFDIGGSVAYAGDATEFLPGALITVVDLTGEERSTTTDSHGLWSLTDLPPGVYFERYELEGYEPLVGIFSLEAFGENDVENPFVSRPPALLTESLLRASAMPFAVTIEDGSQLDDGFGGLSLVYRPAADGAITLEFTHPLDASFASLEDTITGDFIIAVLDSTTGSVFRFSENAIEALNDGAGLITDTLPQTKHHIFVSANARTPIHADPIELDATIEFQAEP